MKVQLVQGATHEVYGVVKFSNPGPAREVSPELGRKLLSLRHPRLDRENNQIGDVPKFVEVADEPAPADESATGKAKGRAKTPADA